MSTAVLCAALTALAVGLRRDRTVAERRLRTVLSATPPPVATYHRSLVGRRFLGASGASVMAALAVAVVIDGWVGLVAAPVVVVIVHRVISRLEPAAVRRRRLRIAADLPLGVDLMVVCLQAGRPVGSAVAVVGASVGGPLGEELRRVGARIELGGDQLAVWTEVGRDPALGSLARAVARALDIGAPVSESLGHLANDLRRERRAAADEVARRVAVRSAGPLGLCFLPAFVLVGIVPTVIGAFRTLLP